MEGHVCLVIHLLVVVWVISSLGLWLYVLTSFGQIPREELLCQVGPFSPFGELPAAPTVLTFAMRCWGLPLPPVVPPQGVGSAAVMPGLGHPMPGAAGLWGCPVLECTHSTSHPPCLSEEFSECLLLHSC